VKLLPGVKKNRRCRLGRSGYVDVPQDNQLTRDFHSTDDVFNEADESERNKMSLPPRYRLRDLLLGDFAFNDDGER
jgi:hypothetical protein